MRKREKVLEVIEKHPKWKVARVAKAVNCSGALVYSVLRSKTKEESTAAATSVLVPTTGVSAEVQTSYEEHNDIPPQPLATRGNLLDVAKTYITKDRQADHGDAEDNFSRIAQYWSVHLGTPVKAHDVAVMMALLKVARIKQNPNHIDNWVDGAGYFACGGEIANLQ